MRPTIDTIAAPIERLPNGAIRIRGTRVGLEAIVVGYDRGDSAEQIAQDFPTLSLEAVYTVIAWYLANRDAVREYMADRQIQSDALRHQHAAEFGNETARDIRARIRHPRGA